MTVVVRDERPLSIHRDRRHASTRPRPLPAKRTACVKRATYVVYGRGAQQRKHNGRGTRARQAARKAAPRCHGGLHLTPPSDGPVPRAARIAGAP